MVFAYLVVMFSGFVFAGCDDRKPTTKSQSSSSRRPESFRTKFAALVRSGNLESADRLVLQELTRRPDDGELLLSAARLAVQRDELSDANDRYRSFLKVSESTPDGIVLEWTKYRCETGDILGAIDELSEMPEQSNRMVRILGDLRTMVGDLWGARRQASELLDRDDITANELFALACQLRRLPKNESYVQAALRRYPDDLRPRVAEAMDLYFDQQGKSAGELLIKICEVHPSYLPAVGPLAAMLADSTQFDRLETLLERCDSSSEWHPGAWYAAGVMAAKDESQREAAAACFANAWLKQGNEAEATARLSPLLSILKNPEAARLAADAAVGLQSLQRNCRNFIGERRGSQTVTLQIATDLAGLGRSREARKWVEISVNMPNERVDRLADRLASISERIQRGEIDDLCEKLARRLSDDLPMAKLPSPRQLASSSVASTDPAKSVSEPSEFPPITLVDESESLGFDFTYDHGQTDGSLGRWLHHTNGGGLAVADFDLDGRDDIYCVQAGGHPNDDRSERSVESSDRLFFNHGGQFRCYDQTRLRQYGYGQGVAAGDINNDGFVDLFVGNIGRNRVLINRGDGTFRDATDRSRLSGEEWTSSVAIADIDADGRPDLIEVNYCDSEPSLTIRCVDHEGGRGLCMPGDFSGTPDVAWISQDNGTFQRHPTWGEVDVPGRGLGVLVANLDAEPDLEAFVANDISNNQLWKRSPDGRWVDQGLIQGLAFGATGRPQGCMGIAWDDLDHDRDLDLVVTNYSNEDNAFYVQESSGQFVDRAESSDLSQHSNPMLGFGTVLADFNQDGHTDLFVANGLVERNRGDGEPFKQPAQLFHWTGRRWSTADVSQSNYFAQPRVGRAAAMGDFNRDGKVDLVIGHLGEASSVLINHSTAGRALVLRLVARDTARDAVGATVTVRTDRRTRTVQRTAGHGFMSSHSPRLSIGLEADETVEAVTVLWPSGRTSDQRGLDTGRTWLIAEGLSPCVIP